MKKKKINKWQRKKLQLRAVKTEFGVESLYFSTPVHSYVYGKTGQVVGLLTVTCSKKNRYKEQNQTIEELRSTLEDTGVYSKVVYEDESMVFQSLYELREYMLIKKLAGI